jgi:predicted NUDIX family NTP pyrophosphohydrolase
MVGEFWLKKRFGGWSIPFFQIEWKGKIREFPEYAKYKFAIKRWDLRSVLHAE